MTGVHHCAVIGVGQMGSGIGHALLLTGFDVTLVDADERSAAAGLERVRSVVQATASRGRLAGSVAETIARLSAASTLDDIREADLVVEAVPEDPGLKVATLGAVSAVVSPTTVIATNTSSISIDQLATAVDHPERFLGLHFFNPVPASILVEVVRGEYTAEKVVDVARNLVAAMGKTAIVVRDSPGFASSRLGVALGLEAIRMVEDGVASPEDIDLAMTLGYKHPIGPLRLTDLVGIDVRLGIAEYLSQELGDRFEPPGLMREMVMEGRLGKKSGRGFYDWT